MDHHFFRRPSRDLGRAALAGGLLDEAIDQFKGWLAIRTKPMSPMRAWTCYECAEALLQRNQSGDREEALALLTEALTLARKLGMPPLAEFATALLERAHENRDSAAPGGLSAREVDVLRLIARGKTDKEIADALSISRRTVSNHVRAILAKTDTGNRTEAALYGARHGFK